MLSVQLHDIIEQTDAYRPNKADVSAARLTLIGDV